MLLKVPPSALNVLSGLRAELVAAHFSHGITLKFQVFIPESQVNYALYLIIDVCLF